MVKGILVNRKNDEAYKAQLKMEHADLIAEMQTVENLPTHERLQLARLRRTQQLKVARQKEKEWMKQQRAKGNNSYNGGNIHSTTTHHFRSSNASAGTARHISFQSSVVLLEAASRNDIQEVAELLKHGITPDAANEDGLTALHQCCIDNNVDMLKLLLEYGANVDSQDSDKWTPLHAAATCGHLELVRILIDHGANLLAVNTDGNMPYDLCDDENTLDFIEAEMSKRGVTQELIDETRSSTEQIMLKELMEVARLGGDLEEPDYQGATPLHIASANGYVRVVEFLLEMHVNVDALDKDMWSPVHAAACWGHMEVLEMLAQCGADLNVRNKDDETPSDICEDPEIRERIEQLKTEQESKRLAEAQRRRVRRSQSSNTRAQSVRRTSLRDKTLTTKKDAVEEARLRLQAQEVFQAPDSTTMDPNGLPQPISSNRSSTSRRDSDVLKQSNAVNDGGASWLSWSANNYNGRGHQNGSNNNHNNNNTLKTNNNNDRKSSLTTNGSMLPHSKSADAVDSTNSTKSNTKMHSYSSRRPPEGRENDELEMTTYKSAACDQHHRSSSASAAAAVVISGSTKTVAKSAETVQMKSNKEAANGKINVQVTVLVDTTNTHHHHHPNQQLQQQQQQQQIVGMEPTFAVATLANLKKQRSLSRNNVLNNYENGSVLGAATTTNLNNHNNNNNSSSNNNNNNNNNLSNESYHNHHALTQTSIVASGNAINVPTAATGGTINSQPLTGSGNNYNNAIAMHNTNATMDYNNGGGSISLSDDLSTYASVNKFSGVTGDVVSDSTSSKRCCIVM